MGYIFSLVSRSLIMNVCNWSIFDLIDYLKSVYLVRSTFCGHDVKPPVVFKLISFLVAINDWASTFSEYIQLRIRVSENNLISYHISYVKSFFSSTSICILF